jgi:hypothetical protein
MPVNTFCILFATHPKNLTFTEYLYCLEHAEYAEYAEYISQYAENAEYAKNNMLENMQKICSTICQTCNCISVYAEYVK